MGHRFEPKSLTFKASKRAYGLTILRPLIRFNTYSRYCYYKPLGYFVIIYLFCGNALNSSRRGPIQTGKVSYTKRNSGWDSSRSFCMLKGFDKALRVSLPHIWVETSGFGNENHVVESDRASVFDLIGVLV